MEKFPLPWELFVLKTEGEIDLHDILSKPDDSSIDSFLEVGLHYAELLPDLHSDFGTNQRGTQFFLVGRISEEHAGIVRNKNLFHKKTRNWFKHFTTKPITHGIILLQNYFVSWD